MWLQHAVEEVCDNILEVQVEEDTPLEDKVTTISEAIQGSHTKIVDLEARAMPSTPQEEKEQREKTVRTKMENIMSLDEECANYM